jgi:hypothetical protein
MYTAVVLTEESRSRLLGILNNFLPNDWQIICHHHTICLNTDAKYAELLNKKFTMIVKDIGFSNKTVAVSVFLDEIKSLNKVPHITIAINPLTNGKPRDSNDIYDWIALKPFLSSDLQPLTVEGILQEIN